MTDCSNFEDGTKRRKVRKGTQSCWECRRRKVRCIFAISTNLVCDNCTRRRTPCVSQELSDGSAPNGAAGSTHVHTIFDPVESLIGRSANGIHTMHNLDASDDIGTHLPSPTSLQNESLSAVPVSCGENVGLGFVTGPAGKFEELNRELISAWPSQQNLDLIYALPFGISSYLHSRVCRPYSSCVDPPSPRDILRPPSFNSHPVLIARKLLVLGTFIQGAIPSAVQELETKVFPLRHVMNRVVDTAIRLVTTKDELIGSVEAIECIMLQALYQNYAGNLHRAWMSARRAINVAQMMTLHRGFNSPTLKILETETRATFDLEHMNFRLAELDAYLSLMLGLPRASLETRHFISPKALERCLPMERMQRNHYIVYERIIKQADSNIDDLTETQEIDRLLQDATAEMSPRWWLTPTFKTNGSDAAETMQDMVRTMDQFSHYHLLIRLHLPYLLRSASDRRYDYSKITATTVSRELLTRYLAFRSSNPAHYYCRGSDFLAFISATILCVAHIQRDEFAGDTVCKLLAHSRSSDRGLMERVLQFIADQNKSGTDTIASRISRILGDLLATEANAASGTNYSTISSKSSNEELECNGKLMNDGKALHVHIPHFGSIKFEKGAISRTADAPETIAPPTQDAPLTPAIVRQSSDQFLPTTSAWGCQSERTSALPGHTAQQVHNDASIEIDGSGVLDHTLLTPQTDDLTWVGEDNWDLQGVDIALFDSLFRGSGMAEDFEERS